MALRSGPNLTFAAEQQPAEIVLSCRHSPRSPIAAWKKTRELNSLLMAFGVTPEYLLYRAGRGSRRRRSLRTCQNLAAHATKTVRFRIVVLTVFADHTNLLTSGLSVLT